MQSVELVQRHDVDEALDVVDREEVPRHVEHRATPLVAWAVGDLHPRNDEPPSGDRGVFDGDREQLPQRLRGVEDPRRRGGEQGDAVSGHGHGIALRSQGVGARCQQDAAWRDGLPGRETCDAASRGRRQHRRQQSRDLLHFVGGIVCDDEPRTVGDHERVGDDDPHARGGRNQRLGTGRCRGGWNRGCSARRRRAAGGEQQGQDDRGSAHRLSGVGDHAILLCITRARHAPRCSTRRPRHPS